MSEEWSDKDRKVQVGVKGGQDVKKGTANELQM